MNKKIEELYNKIDGLNSIIDLQTLEISQLKNKINEAIEYNEHLIRDAKYHLNLGHLKKMKKILLGDKEKDIEFDVLKALNTDLPDDIEMG